jgi:hypothetical protein
VASARTAPVGEGFTRAMRGETDKLTGCLRDMDT